MHASKGELCKDSSVLIRIEVFAFSREISKFSLLCGKYGILLYQRFMPFYYVVLK